jgi:COMPASS component SWD3
MSTMFQQTEPVPCPLARFSALALSADASLLATGTSTGWIILYRVNPDLTEVARKPVHSRGINEILFSSDQKYILTCSDDATVGLSRSSDLSKVNTYNGSLDAVIGCDISPLNDQIVAAGLDTMIHIWATTAAEQLSFIPAHTEPITSIHFNSDGEFVITSSLDGLCRIWCPRLLSLLRTYTQVEAQCVPVLFATLVPSESCFLAAYSGGAVKIYDTTSAKVLGSFSGVINDRNPTVIQFGVRQDGGPQIEVVMPSEDGFVRCWDFCTQQPQWELKVGEGGLNVRLSSDGSLLAVIVNGTNSVHLCRRI